MPLGLLAAVGAAACYGVASVLQSLGVQDAPPAPGLDARLLLHLLRRLPYLVGLGLDAVGFVLNVVGLHTLPIFVVQAIIAGSVGVTAVTAALVMRVRLHRLAKVALCVLVLGVVLLAAGAQPGPAARLSWVGRWALLVAVPAAGLAGLGAARLPGRQALAGLAAVAGACFGGVGIAARALTVPRPWWHAVAQPQAWAIVGFGLLGTLLFATALQRGSVTVAAAVMFAVEALLPSAVGLAVLGDATRPGAGVVLAISGFVLTLGGAIALAPYAEPAAVDVAESRPA